ncbi:MAG: V-type ATP synthase subunit D [Bacteroidales bacterium]|nr:V-type ATP synthase subunit D [Bacteroidales bacterium]MCL2133733.1 V-type ATP synthase subunit D [Bacteroidales bacterium]
MAIKYQLNKTSLNDLEKQLKVRLKALPTLKNKESALRMEVKRAKQRAEELLRELEQKMASYDYMVGLWNEFHQGLIAVRDVEMEMVKIAGVKVPVLKKVLFDVKPYNLFRNPLWFADGVQILQDLAQVGIESEFYTEKMRILDHTRKKTTQKVNLYEKVQIPGYQEAILKIKRFMEDEENLSKAAQKIVKERQQKEEAAA